MTTTSVFLSSIDALMRPSLSLSLSFRTTDVLLEQRDLFARTHQVRKKQSFPFRSSKRRRGVKTHSIFLQAAGDDSVSDPIGKDIIIIIIIAIYVLFLFGALHGVSPKPKDIFRKTHRISSSSSSSSSSSDRDRRTKHTVTPRTRSTRSGSKA